MIAGLPNPDWNPHLVNPLFKEGINIMRGGNEELKTSIRKFYDLLQRSTDKPESVYDFVTFLRSFLRIKSEVPLPTIEIITLIKGRKPTVFYSLRRMSKNNNTLGVLTELSMDLEIAEQKLKHLIES